MANMTPRTAIFGMPGKAELKRAALLSLVVTGACLVWPVAALAQSAINIDLGTGAGLSERVVQLVPVKAEAEAFGEDDAPRTPPPAGGRPALKRVK